MTVKSKTETVETHGLTETVEYVTTALKQGYNRIVITGPNFNIYEVSIEKQD